MKMTYPLENPGETQRLESQSTLAGYQLERELESVKLQPGQRVLDAGCGTALVSRYLALRVPDAHFEACDQSELRLADAKKLCVNSSIPEIHFFKSQLEEITVPESRYDWVICRYVFEHLGDHQRVIQCIHRILRPGGKIHIIQFDGILFNLTHFNPALQTTMDTIQRKLSLDLFIGRKLPGFLLQGGFRSPNWTLESVVFQGPELTAERNLTRQRLTFALPILSQILGSQLEAERFREDYCQEMMKPESTLFYNKFIIQAEKK